MQSRFKKAMIVMLLGSLTLGVNAQVTDSLRLHYSFDAGSSVDDVGSNDAKVYGATLCEDRFGNANSAYEFDRDSMVATITNQVSLTEGTYSIWIKPDTSIFNGGQVTIMAWSGIMIINRFSGVGKAFGHFDGTTHNNTTNDETSILPKNEWIHFVVTNDGDSTKTYVNGKLEKTYPEKFLDTYAIRKLYIGYRGFGAGAPTDYYKGKLDDFRFYNRAITALEVDTLYNMADPNARIENEQLNSKVAVYPNPSTGIYNLEVEFPISIVEWEVFDVKGKQLATGNKEDSMINISDKPSGAYTLKAKTGNGEVFSRVLIKE